MDEIYKARETENPMSVKKKTLVSLEGRIFWVVLLW